MSDALITKYRPQKFGDVRGHDAVVKSLQANLKKGSTRTFMFSGPPGTGKTTLARLVAQSIGCLPRDLLEIDAAVYTGIDDIRAVTSPLQYRPVGEGAVKAIIVDEVQGLSKAAAQALLKNLEEPQDWVRWFLCTTEPTKILESIRTRCTRYELKPVAVDTLIDLLDDIAEKEDLELDTKIIDLCAKEAAGSPRQAIANLAACIGAKTLSDAKELLRSAIASEEAVNLARALVKGAGWVEIQQILNDLKDTSPESVRHVIRAYLTSVILKSNKEETAGRGLEMLQEFSEPFHPSDGISPLVMACGRLAFRQ